MEKMEAEHGKGGNVDCLEEEGKEELLREQMRNQGER